MKPSVNPNPGITLGLLNRQPAFARLEIMLLLFRLVNLIKCSAISEVVGLCLRPSAEDWIIDRHQFQLR